MTQRNLRLNDELFNLIETNHTELHNWLFIANFCLLGIEGNDRLKMISNLSTSIARRICKKKVDLVEPLSLSIRAGLESQKSSDFQKTFINYLSKMSSIQSISVQTLLYKLIHLTKPLNNFDYHIDRLASIDSRKINDFFNVEIDNSKKITSIDMLYPEIKNTISKPDKVEDNKVLEQIDTKCKAEDEKINTLHDKLKVIADISTLKKTLGNIYFWLSLIVAILVGRLLGESMKTVFKNKKKIDPTSWIAHDLVMRSRIYVRLCLSTI